VVVFGLYGAASMKWDMSIKVGLHLAWTLACSLCFDISLLARLPTWQPDLATWCQALTTYLVLFSWVPTVEIGHLVSVVCVCLLLRRCPGQA
jgi:hypothetical protein